MGCGANTSANSNTTGKKVEQTEEVVKKDGGTMVFSANTDPTCLNPFFQQNRITFTVNNALFDPLFIVDIILQTRWNPQKINLHIQLN